MVLIPLLKQLLDESAHVPTRCPMLRDLHDQNFGLGLTDVLQHAPCQQLPHLPHRLPLACGYTRHWRPTAPGESGVSSLTNDEHELKINLDVQQFRPEELKVTVEDGFIIVHGNHSEKLDEHGYVSREFTRRYKIPEGVDATQLVSNLSSDGVLSLHAPKMIKDQETRQIPIVHTNEPLRIKDPRKQAQPSTSDSVQPK